jgi:BirA family transcriptional regulator, biotin operon repressor / biotin---[acetyl-CoA-carboxylase] ligase
VSGTPEPLPQRVFARLDDREFQSGEALAADLKVTRAAVWKAVETLRELGVNLEAQSHKGYRLAPGVGALDGARILEQLPAELQARIEALLVEWNIESTNTRLLEAYPPAAGKAAVLLAECQTGGRGRRGRTWVAPPGGAICLSVAWQFPEMPADLSALSLVVGICVAGALRHLGVDDLRVKWPNDLITPRGKLGGILIEMRAEASGPVHVVIGIGLNVRLEEAVRAQIAASGNVADDLIGAWRSSGPPPERNTVVAALLARLLPALERFPREGFTPYLADWHASDALVDRGVRVENAGEVTRGLARGVDVHGALLVETPQGVHRFISGEVTVRPET